MAHLGPRFCPKSRKVYVGPFSVFFPRANDLLQSPEMARPGISARKYPPKRKNKIPKMPVLGIFFGIFWDFFEVPEFQTGGYLFGFLLWKVQVEPSQASVAGRGVLNSRAYFDFLKF